MSKRIKNLSDQDIEAVCKIIDGWSSENTFTWKALVESIENRFGKSWSRQALDRHLRIKMAFTLKKKVFMKITQMGKNEHLPVDLRKALESIERLENENKRLAQENIQLLEQFIRWSYNAESKGISKDVLDKPLHNIDRGSTRG